MQPDGKEGREGDPVPLKRRGLRNCFAIYTCWTTGDDRSYLIYDHPTPITEEGELPRTLQNLVERGIEDHILLFPGPTHPAIEQHLRAIAGRFPLDVHVLTGEDIGRIAATLKQAGFPSDYNDVMDMAGYGRLRNMSLVGICARRSSSTGLNRRSWACSSAISCGTTWSTRR